MKKRIRQRGEVTVSSLIGILVLLFLVYELFQFGPVLLSQFQFQDSVQNISKFSLNKDPASVRNEVVAKAGEYGLPVDGNMIGVVRDRTYTRITVNYELSVDWLPGQAYKWQVNVDEESRIF